MISSSEIQSAYNDLYKEIRKYIWGFDAVNALADLEIASYTACADVYEIKKRLDLLHMYAKEVERDDEDLKSAFDAFYKLLDDQSDVYVKLLKVKEDIQDEGR